MEQRQKRHLHTTNFSTTLFTRSILTKIQKIFSGYYKLYFPEAILQSFSHRSQFSSRHCFYPLISVVLHDQLPGLAWSKQKINLSISTVLFSFSSFYSFGLIQMLHLIRNKKKKRRKVKKILQKLKISVEFLNFFFCYRCCFLFAR